MDMNRVTSFNGRPPPPPQQFVNSGQQQPQVFYHGGANMPQIHNLNGMCMYQVAFSYIFVSGVQQVQFYQHNALLVNGQVRPNQQYAQPNSRPTFISRPQQQQQQQQARNQLQHQQVKIIHHVSKQQHPAKIQRHQSDVLPLHTDTTTVSNNNPSRVSSHIMSAGVCQLSFFLFN
jgi:hypothetical protein